MDELEISGKRYISSVRAAKEHKYHSDYIGQLVRGGKVVGQKVGRAWYVDANSLAEYLGKEVPARGPVASKHKADPIPVVEIPVEEKIIISKRTEEVTEIIEEVAAEETMDSEPLFVMPLRKSGRQHVIEAIDTETKKDFSDIYVPPVNKIEEKIEELPEKTIEVFMSEAAEEIPQEEERFIPLKINKEPARKQYIEPEDSFYKVSQKGLRYVAPHTTARNNEEEIEAAVIKPRVGRREGSNSKVVLLSMLFLAGIVSLGVGVLMSYYLHSVTTVIDTTQTSGVMLGN